MLYAPRGIKRKVSNARLQLVVESFNRSGESNHTEMGLTLAPLLNYLVEHGIGFQLTKIPDGGYHVRKFNFFAKLAVPTGSSDEHYGATYKCPACEGTVLKSNYCPSCGQPLRYAPVPVSRKEYREQYFNRLKLHGVPENEARRMSTFRGANMSLTEVMKAFPSPVKCAEEDAAFYHHANR